MQYSKFDKFFRKVLIIYLGLATSLATLPWIYKCPWLIKQIKDPAWVLFIAFLIGTIVYSLILCIVFKGARKIINRIDFWFVVT